MNVPLKNTPFSLSLQPVHVPQEPFRSSNSNTSSRAVTLHFHITLAVESCYNFEHRNCSFASVMDCTYLLFNLIILIIVNNTYVMYVNSLLTKRKETEHNLIYSYVITLIMDLNWTPQIVSDNCRKQVNLLKNTSNGGLIATERSLPGNLISKIIRSTG